MMYISSNMTVDGRHLPFIGGDCRDHRGYQVQSVCLCISLPIDFVQCLGADLTLKMKVFPVFPR